MCRPRGSWQQIGNSRNCVGNRYGLVALRALGDTGDVHCPCPVGIRLLAGIGFTASLLVTELSFGLGDPANDHPKVAILLSSVTAALLATLILSARNRHHREVEAAESVDVDRDGIPDVCQHPTD